MRSPAEPILSLVALACITALNLYAAGSSSLAARELHKDKRNATHTIPRVLRPAALTVETTEHYGLEAEGDWSSLMPTGHGFGFVRLGSGAVPFELSVYHQLHCLSGLRRQFTYGSGKWSQERVEWHTHHCLNYLRQAVLCNADTTVEPAYTFHLTENVTTPAASGMGVVHTCVDWTQLRSYVEENLEQTRGIPLQAD
ncbi:hypothetical protein DFH06DRAFT_1252137 [Mycena polygramma]|nr:hypothetical protein DFH06DRAFT_1252118 [Mycena polygramma]KAJ7605968.1 hypothetical protein DFH06DRAFT_1252137 [Mycena polygramma]